MKNEKILKKYNKKRNKQPEKEKHCYCGHTTTCDCGNPSIYEFNANKLENFKI